MQAKITDNSLKNLPLTIDTSFNPISGHKSSEIWLAIRDGGTSSTPVGISGTATEMTLQTALGKSNLCGKNLAVNSYSSASIPKKVMFATEIEVTYSTGAKSLQEAINAGEVLYKTNYEIKCNANSDTGDLYNYDSCGEQGILNRICEDSGYISGNFCSSENGDVVRTYKTAGCSGSNCVNPTPANIEQQNCQANGAYSASWGNHYCSGSNVRIDRTLYNACRNAACGNFISDSNNYPCSGTCSGGDCYGGWVNPTYCYQTGTYGGDTCSGSNEGSAYTCASDYSTPTGCKDVASLGTCYVGRISYQQYKYRTVYCFSP